MLLERHGLQVVSMKRAPLRGEDSSYQVDAGYAADAATLDISGHAGALESHVALIQR